MWRFAGCAATVPSNAWARIRCVVSALTGGPWKADQKASSPRATGPFRVGRPINLVRLGEAVKTLQRAQFSLIASTYSRLVADDF